MADPGNILGGSEQHCCSILSPSPPYTIELCLKIHRGSTVICTVLGWVGGLEPPPPHCWIRPCLGGWLTIGSNLVQAVHVQELLNVVFWPMMTQWIDALAGYISFCCLLSVSVNFFVCWLQNLTSGCCCSSLLTLIIPCSQ